VLPIVVRRGCTEPMTDAIFVALTVVLFGGLALALRAVERL
jgi:hypothetical protein